MDKLNYLFFFVCIGMMGVSLHHKGNEVNNSSFCNGKIVVGLLLLGFLIRFIGLGEVPAGMNQDEVMAALDARALAKFGTDRLGMSWPVHLTAWGYGQMSALLSYMMIPFIRFFGFNIVSIRLVPCLVSCLALIAIYYLSKTLYNQRVGIFVLFVAVINPWQIMQSRWALDCNLFPHFFLFGFTMLIIGIQKKSNLLLTLSMVLFGVTMYSYGLAFYIVPIFLILAGSILLIKKEISWKQMSLCALVYFVVASPIIIVMVINAFKLETLHWGKITLPYFPNSIRMNSMLLFSKEPFVDLAKNGRALWTVLIQTNNQPWNSIPEYGTLYLWTMPLCLVGLFNRVKKKTEESMLLWVWLILALLLGLMINQVNINRINILYYPLILFVGLGIDLIYSRFKRAIIPIFLSFMISFSLFSTDYFIHYNEQYGYYFYHDLVDSLEKLKQKEWSHLVISPNASLYQSNVIVELFTDFILEDEKDSIEVRSINNNEKLNSSTTYLISIQEVTNLNLNGWNTEYFGYYVLIEKD